MQVQPASSDLEYGEPFNKAFDQIRSGIDRAVGSFNDIVDRVNEHSWLLGPAGLW